MPLPNSLQSSQEQIFKSLSSASKASPDLDSTAGALGLSSVQSQDEDRHTDTHVCAHLHTHTERHAKWFAPSFLNPLQSMWSLCTLEDSRLPGKGYLSCLERHSVDTHPANPPPPHYLLATCVSCFVNYIQGAN